MNIIKLKRPKVEIGDLVYHLLYGREWAAIILEIETSLRTPRPGTTLVHMVAGTEYEFFFKKSLTNYRITDSMGYITHHWLRPLAIKEMKA